MIESSPAPVWERPESVEKFAGRDPDLRLMEILDRADEPARLRVLDLGCAAGRNTVVLAQRGFDFRALDGSRSMIDCTQKRVTAILGKRQARRRVQLGRMHDLGVFDDSSFDLVVALGIFHCASSLQEWSRAVDECARVLAPMGLLLVSVFTPETDPHGTGVHPIPGHPDLYSGFTSGRTFLVDASRLDAEMQRRLFEPVLPSKTVRVELEKGRRVVVNALYAQGVAPAARASPRKRST